MSHVPVGEARFSVLPRPEDEVLKIPAVQKGFVMLFLSAGQIGVASADVWSMRREPQMPFGPSGATGSVQSTDGVRTRYVAPGMNRN
jgi:hypothetical protein